ncbi:MAG TPA: type II secretion system protein [Candidatus Paceibacterota bacterium]|nr:type II secretion system protein [Candidatus Paceibacterota bacterium]
MKSDKWRVTSGEKMMSNKRQVMRRSKAHHSSLITHHSGFTLIELLVVISIIGVLAAFTLTVLKSAKRHQYISHTQAEMGLLETAIQRYHDAYGFYPPGNGSGNPRVNQLYYELEGTTFNPANNLNLYTTLDGGLQISSNNVNKAFGVGGFVNCTRPGSAEDAHSAQNFLPGLKPKQYNAVTNPWPGGPLVTILTGSVGGPDQNYKPLGASGLNPWRYASPGTNNPNSYDLWMQLVISGQTNLICNWNEQVQINSPLP